MNRLTGTFFPPHTRNPFRRCARQNRISARFLLLSMLLLSTATCLAQDSTSPENPPPNRPLTPELVFGPDRIRLTDPAPRNLTWLDDEYLYTPDSPLQTTHAVSGQTKPLFQTDELEAALKAADIPESDRQLILDGNWSELDPGIGVCLLHSDNRLIRVGLDGTGIVQVSGLPDEVQLLTLGPTGQTAAFVSHYDLWCVDFDTAELHRLTHDGTSLTRNGYADWVYYEEILHRSWKAFRFSPDGQHIVFQSFDDTDVPAFTVIDHQHAQQKMEAERYPLAGQNNPRVRLGVISSQGGDVTWLQSPWPDATTLVTHFNWWPKQNAVYWYAQNREQTWLEIVRSDISSGNSTRVLKETTDAWVMSPGDLTFLSDGSFLMTSERSGRRHLEHVSADGQQRHSLSAGHFDIGRLIAINEAEDYVVVSANRDSSIADSLYRVSLSSGTMQRLDNEAGHHTAIANPSGTYLLDTCSQLDQPRRIVLRPCDGTVTRVIHESVLPEAWQTYGMTAPVTTSIPLDPQHNTTATVLFPPSSPPRDRHPVWIRIYGGPGYQRVRNRWRPGLVDQLLAAQGIVVLSVDPRTASGFGARGAWQAHRQLGIQETRDIEAVCDWLRQQTWADPQRIGLSGHSYGGYLTAYVMTHSKCIHAGIAGAPVTDWANYDTIYTERYMGRPQDNPDGYQRSSVVEAAEQLHGKLLLVHGLLDDNVHVSNSFQLVEALQQAGHSFEFMVYPQARHAIHDIHFRRLKYDFICRTMLEPARSRESSANLSRQP